MRGESGKAVRAGGKSDKKRDVDCIQGNAVVQYQQGAGNFGLKRGRK
jgi:hypothetical protein